MLQSPGSGPVDATLHVLVVGIVSVFSLLPVVRHLGLICPVRYAALLVALVAEAFVCLAMLAGKTHWRLAGLETRQAAVLAAALRCGRLEDEGERAGLSLERLP